MKDFGASWRDGLAFQSVVHAIRPDLVDMQAVRRRGNKENLEEAFALAENELGIPRLLDPEGVESVSLIDRDLILFVDCLRRSADVDVDKPDEKSIMTYVAQFLKHHPNPQRSETDGQHDEVAARTRTARLTRRFSVHGRSRKKKKKHTKPPPKT